MMNSIKFVIILTCLLGFANYGFSQAVQPMTPQSATTETAQAAQVRAAQLRAQAAQLQAQAAQLLAQAQAGQSLSGQQSNPLVGLIAMADAKRIALTAAGIAEKDARNFKIELDNEGALMVYEVEFNAGFHEYEFKIDAHSGIIIGTKKKFDLF